MNRLLVASAIVVGALATATPAVAGLAGNPSFSHKLPVRVPSSGQVVQFDDHGQEVGDKHGSEASRHASPTSTATRSAEPGDDNGGASRSAEPGDDNGGMSGSAEPGDDHGSQAGSATATPTSAGQPTDDHGGSGHGSGK